MFKPKTLVQGDVHFVHLIQTKRARKVFQARLANCLNLLTQHKTIKPKATLLCCEGHVKGIASATLL